MHWIIIKAQSAGLDVDWDYLGHFEPHYDSKLHDSMSLKYRMLGSGTRTIGAYSQQGECIHEAAVNRMKHVASSYAPENLTGAAVRSAFHTSRRRRLLLKLLAGVLRE